MNYHRRYICLLLQVIYFIANCLAENLILNVNYKKPIAVTSNAFLSFTLDPVTLLDNIDELTKNIERSTNMAQGLVPAYVRLGGSQSNSYVFEQAYSNDIDSNDTVFGKQWSLIYQWAKNVGLDLIVCIAPRYIENESKLHSKNSMNITELLSLSDLMGYNISWQLGYECQTKCNLSGGDLGQYVANFREMLKIFPRYSNSLITGPDIVAYETAQQQKYLQDYLNSADAALSAITWHPDFASVSLNNDSIFMHYDNMAANKNELYKIINRTAEKKPLWIAESKSEEFKDKYLGALIWTTRLGNAAKLGIQVVMRQPSNFYKATPDYWVSLLHKTLVGRQVLKLKLQSLNNESYVHFYSQCTKPSALYDKGAITIFGVNLTPREVTANLKGLKIKTLHKYILSPNSETGNKMLSEKVLLNNKPLDLINDKKLPNLNPKIVIKPDDLELKLSSGNIGFWVIPNAKVKACVYPEEEPAENLMRKKLSKRHKNIIQQDNEEEKINDTNDHQHSVQESGRVRRDVGQKLVEIGLRKENALKKRSRFDNVKDTNERKTKRRDELLIPFNPRTTDSSENNFYGFLRRKPVKGFPESDIFITTGDSLEQNNQDYDYVRDESNENASMVKNTQNRKELETQDHAEDDTWLEMENDYIPNEFFENVKVSNARVQENPKNYSDLWEAEFFPQENSRVFQEQTPLFEKEEKRAVENGMQKLINYYDSKEQEYSTKSQVVKSPISINHQVGGRKLKIPSGASSFFYQPSQAINYNNKNTRHEEKKSNKDEIFDVNISNDRGNINAETIKFSRPADVNTDEYSIHEIQYPILHNRRTKRSNSKAKMQKILTNKMIKENEENSKNYKIIQASHLSKKLRRAKRDSEILADSSSEIASVNIGSAQSKRNVEDSMTQEEYEKIMEGEQILPSATMNSDYEFESDYEVYDTTAETITSKSNALKYGPSYETSTIEISSTPMMDNSEINEISEQHRNVNNIKRFVNSEFSPISEENSNNSNIVDNNNIVEQKFFRAESPDVQSDRKTTTYDRSQIVPEIYSTDKSDLQELVVSSATEIAQETTREETQNLISEEEKADGSSCPKAVTQRQKDEKWRDNNDKLRLKKSMSSSETTKISEEQTTTETILPKSNDNGQQNGEDDQNMKPKASTQSKKNGDAKKLKTTHLKASREFARYMKNLNKPQNLKQMGKMSKRLMKTLLQSYHNELMKVMDAKTRNLKRREIWDSDDIRHLIDQGGFIGVLIDDDVLYKDTNNKNYEIPIEFVKETRYPKYNEDDGHRVSKLLEYMKRISINKNYRPNDLARFAQNLFDGQNINQNVNDKTAADLNNIYKNLESKHDNSDMSITDKNMELTKDARIKNEKSVRYHGEKEDILNVKKTEDAEDTERNLIFKNVDTDKEMLNIKKFNDITELEYRMNYLANKRENIADDIYQIAKDTREIIKPYNSNEEIQNNIHVEMLNNDKANKNVEEIIGDNIKLSKFKRGNARRQRDINTQRRDKYLKQLLHFLLTRTDVQDESSSDMYDYLTEDSEEIFSDPPIPIHLLRKEDESPLNSILLQKLKNYLASSKKDLEINRQIEKKYKSPKYIVFIPTKNEDSYKRLEVQDFDDDLLESFEIPRFESEYLPRTISDSSEELVYEDLSDLLNDSTENISDKTANSSESMQNVSVDVEDVGINRESEMEDVKIKKEKINCLKMNNQMSSDECGMFLLFPWRENEKTRQRREIRNRINEGINQIGDEMQSKSNKFSMAENIKDENIENVLNTNNIDKQEKEKMITEKEAETNYLQTQIDRKNRDNLLEDFVKARQKNYLYKKKIFS
ncbi:uncharacterized protein PF11_0213-like [Nylanderia fulva]|uniref:uncharacterized protein PF11_0213-like n=1 Tax=Nylanderia fulva TaxID=613905 RepID=UPI0010FB4F26|nr:uncharacterized protein PF11_0213-like [Nylanderia fulva]